MRTTLCTFAIALVLGCTSDIAAQRRPGPEGQGQRLPGRVEKFRKMRLIETLKLGEEASVRFFAKQAAHEDAVRDLMDERNAVLDGMEQQLRDDKPDDRELRREADKALDVDAKIFAERQRFQRDVRDLLSPEQFSKFIIFERNFGRQVRGALQEMREERRGRERQE